MPIRKAEKRDLSRIVEIFVFNNRINYFPIFKDAGYSFGTLQVIPAADNYFGKKETFGNLFVAEDDGIIKGFIEIRKTEIVKLYVEPLFQNCGTGSALVEFALQNFQADFLWALEKTQGLFLFTVGTDFSRLAQENTRKAQRNILLNCGGNKCCPKGCKNKNRNLRLPFVQGSAGGFSENSRLQFLNWLVQSGIF